MANPKTFLEVLQGIVPEGNGTGKVIDSNENDHVFVYFADHGAPGLVAFGDDYLTAKDLNEVSINYFKNFKSFNVVYEFITSS